MYEELKGFGLVGRSGMGSGRQAGGKAGPGHTWTIPSWE